MLICASLVYLLRKVQYSALCGLWEGVHWQEIENAHAAIGDMGALIFCVYQTVRANQVGETP